ncbi:MAG: FAD-binding protein [SAR202 cluster bacterium]|nr:FAD-binding protein [SAR202 cluster bacterium]
MVCTTNHKWRLLLGAFEIVKTDVLVVGGGGAGCRAAIEAHDRGSNVTMIVKGRLGHSGCTFNVGTSAAVGPWGDPNDTTDSAMRDLLAHGGFLGIQDLAKTLVEESPDSVMELERWGIDFERNDDGSIAMHHASAHSYTRNLAFKPRPGVKFDYGILPGFAMMDILIQQVRKRNINVMDDVTLVDLVSSEGNVIGAVGLDCTRGVLIVFSAKATILATGTYSQIFDPTTVDRFETGDGHAAAYRAGADLIDMESTQFVSTSIGFPPGTRFLNARGETFLDKYGITDPKIHTKEELCYAIGMEVKQGRGTEDGAIYLDLTEPLRNEPAKRPHRFAEILGEYVEKLNSKGEIIDPRKEPVESQPRSHTTIGGIRINTKCETTLPGLYATGGVAGGVYGHARPEGYTSMITVVFGRRAGLYASMGASDAADPSIEDSMIQPIVDRTSVLVDREFGADTQALKTELRRTVRKNAWVIKDEAGLLEGLETVESIKSSYSILKAKDGFEWESALELPNMLLSAELMFKCSLERKESRGAFFRSDYPNTDENNWLCNIIIRQVGGESVIDTVPVDLKYCRPDPQLPPVRLHVGKGS